MKVVSVLSTLAIISQAFAAPLNARNVLDVVAHSPPLRAGEPYEDIADALNVAKRGKIDVANRPPLRAGEPYEDIADALDVAKRGKVDVANHPPLRAGEPYEDIADSLNVGRRAKIDVANRPPLRAGEPYEDIADSLNVGKRAKPDVANRPPLRAGEPYEDIADSLGVARREKIDVANRPPLRAGEPYEDIADALITSCAAIRLQSGFVIFLQSIQRRCDSSTQYRQASSQAEVDATIQSLFEVFLREQITFPVLLVPTAEHLLTQTDVDSQIPYTELVSNEDFLSSHVLRIQGTSANPGRDWPNSREGKAKTKQYNTLNGRVVVIKDSFVYTNRGFGNLTQAQLLQDEVYYSDSSDLSSWLIYYISRPLVGSQDRVIGNSFPVPGLTTGALSPNQTLAAPIGIQKKEISSFNDLLNSFPIIAKHMQPGVERLVKKFSNDIEEIPPERPTSSSATTLVGEELDLVRVNESTPLMGSNNQLNRTTSRASTTLSSTERYLREMLETLILSVIDVFQSVDKQQLSLLGERTELSGPVVEKLIERYVVEQIHEVALFPKILASTSTEDHALEGYIKQMGDADILQIGISDADAFGGKRELSQRVRAGIIAFGKMSNARSPQEMLDDLLETQQCLTTTSRVLGNGQTIGSPDKEMVPTSSMNADTLVSLLLIVVIRSNVRSLQARLTYMRDFVFFTDVEGGHAGYALSTFEAVLSYLSTNSKALRKIGMSNRQLWRAVRKGDIPLIKSILDPSTNSEADIEGDFRLPDLDSQSGVVEHIEDEFTNGKSKAALIQDSMIENDQTLNHVFPLEISQSSHPVEKPKLKKRVSMDIRSLSGSSIHSFASMSSTVGSVQSLIDGETTAEQLCQTQDAASNSILFMAIESVQVNVLRYLLQLKHLISFRQVTDDRNGENQSLLSTAIQTGHSGLIDAILDYVLDNASNDDEVKAFVASQDVSGRSAAHYCFSAPYLIPLIGHLLPWQQKDKNGQTPLFAICRSYDNENYHELAMDAIAAATKQQVDNDQLQLAYHIDNKGNTLLHTVNDAEIIKYLLSRCDADPNAQNEKKFTPLMVASKYARLDSIRSLFGDVRIDLQARDARGLTAVEVAKDDEVRNRIDDMVLLLADPLIGHRRTTITRGILVDDGSIRLVVKSGAPSNHGTITVTTSRRSLQDFENLVSWLSLEQPASWLPSISRFRSPFQVPSRPSKQVLRDTQLWLEGFLKAMLSHSTFGTHEMLWEFFLVPDVDWRSLADRAKRKAEIRVENLSLEYKPLTSRPEIIEVGTFTGHAIDQLQHLHDSLKAVARSVSNIKNVSNDLAEAHRVAMKIMSSTMTFIPKIHLEAAHAYTAALYQTEHSPHSQLHHDVLNAFSTSSAILQSLTRPSSLIGSINVLRDTISKMANASNTTTSRRSQSNRLLAGIGSLIDNTRGEDAESKAAKAKREMETLGRELRYTQLTNANELAAWQLEHSNLLVKGLREYAKGMVVRERERLERMKRAQRKLSHENDLLRA